MSPARRNALFVALLAIYIASPAPAQKLLPDGIKDLATQIAAGVAKEQKQKIAVLPFRELDGRTTVLGTYISEQLVTDLFAAGVLDIVERAMLDKLIGEIRLGQSGVIDPETAKKLGKVAGVDAIVTGSITDLQTYVALNCRLIDAQTGRIFGAAQTRIVKDDDVRKIMGMQLAQTPTDAEKPRETGRPSTTGGTAQAPSSKVAQQQQVQGVLFEIKECTLSGTTVECALLITSKRGEDQEISFSMTDSRLVDEDGNEVRVGQVSVGANVTKRTDRLLASRRARLTSGIPLGARIAFEGASPDIEKGALVDLRAYVSRDRLSVQFRDVPLTRE